MDQSTRGVRQQASTTWAWRKVKLRAVPPGQGIASPKATPSRFCLAPKRGQWLQIEVRYHGGSESSYVLRYRGNSWRFPGWMALADVLTFDSWETR